MHEIISILLEDTFGCILLCLLIVCCIVMIGLLLFMAIDDLFWKFRPVKRDPELDRLIAEVQKTKKDKAEAPALEILLYQDLKEYCLNKFIPLKYGKEFFIGDLSDAAGYIQYIRDLRNKDTYAHSIFIKNTDEEDIDSCNVWILAHELGHFESITKYRDSSEIGADAEALKLCMSFLSQEALDNEYLQISLKCHFMEQEKLNEFEHKANMFLEGEQV